MREDNSDTSGRRHEMIPPPIPLLRCDCNGMGRLFRAIRVIRGALDQLRHRTELPDGDG